MGLFSGIIKGVGSALSGNWGGVLDAAGDIFSDDNISSAGAAYGQSQTNATNLKIMRETNAFNQLEAQKNRDFQHFLSDTSYQRAVTDMKHAGLNPMLAYSNGGASTPVGSTASGVTTSVRSPISAAVSNALEAKTVMANVDKVKADTDVSKAQADLIRAQIPELATRMHQQTATAGNFEMQTKLTEKLVDKALADTDNIKTDTVRLRAATANLLEQTKNLPVTRAQMEVAIEKLRAEIVGQDIKNLGEGYGLAGKENEFNYQKGSAGSAQDLMRSLDDVIRSGTGRGHR